MSEEMKERETDRERWEKEKYGNIKEGKKAEKEEELIKQAKKEKRRKAYITTIDDYTNAQRKSFPTLQNK
jgi:hypothetical protein